MMCDKPEKPNESDCCGSGCNPCIFDVYEEQMKKWESKQFLPQSTIALNQSKYLPFIVDRIEEITSQIRLFEFQPVKLISHDENEIVIVNAQKNVDYEVLCDNLNLKAGHYLIMKGQYETYENGEVIKHNISRSYTPVLHNSDKSVLKVIVFIYPEGKMSKFLEKLNINDIVFWRGPYNEFKYNTNSNEKVLLIGGGTGIIPLYNTAKDIVENDTEETIVKCVASFKTIESFILRNELLRLQDYWNFHLKIYITDQKTTDYVLKYNEDVTFSKLVEEVLFQEFSFYTPNKCLIVICGPPPFNSFVSDTALRFGVIKEDLYIYK